MCLLLDLPLPLVPLLLLLSRLLPLSLLLPLLLLLSLPLYLSRPSCLPLEQSLSLLLLWLLLRPRPWLTRLLMVGLLCFCLLLRPC